MPVMDGITFMREIRAKDELRATPVIIVSTEGSRVHKQELADLDVKAYLRKPVTPEELVLTIKSVL